MSYDKSRLVEKNNIETTFIDRITVNTKIKLRILNKHNSFFIDMTATSLDNSLIYVFIQHNTFYLKYLYAKRRETILLISLIRDFQSYDTFHKSVVVEPHEIANIRTRNL